MSEQNKHTAEEELIINYLYGNTTDEEVQYVESLMENSEDYREFHHKMSLIMNLSDEVVNTPEVDVDDAFQKFIDKTDAQDIGITSKKTKTIPLVRIVAAVAALIVIALGVLFIFRDVDNKFNTIATSNKELTHTLEDGTVVNLHEKSSIQWYVTGEKERNVIIDSGSVEFIVAHNIKHPFIVQYQNYEVVVLGTSFDITTKSDSLFSVLVTEGKVLVRNNALQDSVILGKDEKTTSKNKGLFSRELQKEESIEDNVLQFSDIEISEVMKIVASKYKVKIDIKDSSFAQQRLTATFRELQVGTIMKMIEKMYGVNVSYADSVYSFAY